MLRCPSTTPGIVSTSTSRIESRCTRAKARTCSWAKRMSSSSRSDSSPISASISPCDSRKLSGA